MARLSINEMTTYRWSFESDVAEWSAVGIPAIGVWRQKLADFGEERGADLLEESGLQVSNLNWAGGFTGSCGRPLKDSLEDAFEAIRLASDLGTSCLVIYSGARAGHTNSHARRLVKDSLVELLPLAEELDVTLAIKPVHPDCAADMTFLTCLEEMLALLDSCNSRHLKFAFDTYHLGWNCKWLDRIHALAPQVAIVHLADGNPPIDSEQNCCPIGQGCIPLDEIVAALSEGGYNGDYDIKLIGPEIESADYRQLLVDSKRAYDELMSGRRVTRKP